MTIKNDILWRIYLAFFMVALVALAVLFQAFRVQVTEGGKWKAMADSLTTRYRTIEAERGNILSADGRLLATSLPFFEIRFDAVAPSIDDDLFYRKVDSLALCMSRQFQDHDRNYYKQKLIAARNQGNRYLLIKRKVTYPELQQIKQWPLFRMGRYKGGFIVEQQNKREIPFGVLAHRTIGYVRSGPGAQSVGLEASFNDYLKGRDGKRLMQRVAGGVWMPLNDENEIEPKDGADLITTIDLNIQDVAEEALLRALELHDADHGTAIVMEVATGKVRAISNLGRMGESGYWEKYNYAIGEASEPGSTFKTATMMALFEDGLVEPTDTVDIGFGETYYHGQAMKDAKPHNYGRVTVQRAFELSSNVGISKLAHQHYKADPQQFIDHLKRFRLHEKTGIEIKGEGKPLIKNSGDEGWSLLSIPWMSVGYEVKLTPLQILTFYNAIANSGKMMKPYLVESINAFGKPIKSFAPQAIETAICSEETLQKIHDLLVGVVENGTARYRLYNNNYRIAGKTGTAQIAQGSGGYAKVYQSSFVGYFPADRPQYSCIVVVTAPSKGVYYGGSVAGPVFKEIADKIYANQIQLQAEEAVATTVAESVPAHQSGYAQDFSQVFSALGLPIPDINEEPWVYTIRDGDSVNVQQLNIPKDKVPNVRGMGLRDALYVLENRGLEVIVEGRGKVYHQSVLPGTPVTSGRTITIKLS